MVHAVGSIVRIQGLLNPKFKHYNGKKGKFTKLLRDGRFAVIVEGETSAKSFKEANIEFLPDDSDSDSSDGSLPCLVERHDGYTSSEDESNSKCSSCSSMPPLLPPQEGNDDDSSYDDSPARRGYVHVHAFLHDISCLSGNPNSNEFDSIFPFLELNSLPNTRSVP